MYFEKYHGLGNHFILLNEKDITPPMTPDFIKTICSHEVGLGGDGLIIVKNQPLAMDFYNKDGSPAAMCGNGIRCFYHYALHHGLAKGKDIVVTKAGPLSLSLAGNFMKNLAHIEVNMGRPHFYKKGLKGLEKSPSCQEIEVPWKQHILKGLFLHLGVPHLVVDLTENTDNAKVLAFDPKALQASIEACRTLMKDPLFVEGTNINFVKRFSKTEIRLLTYERGVGFTSACGTGATASVIALQAMGHLAPQVKVTLQHGTLNIKKKASDYIMTGPSIRIASGTYHLPIK